MTFVGEVLDAGLIGPERRNLVVGNSRGFEALENFSRAWLAAMQKMELSAIPLFASEAL